MNGRNNYGHYMGMKQLRSSSRKTDYPQFSGTKGFVLWISSQQPGTNVFLIRDRFFRGHYLRQTDRKSSNRRIKGI